MNKENIMPKVTIEFHIRVDDESIVNHAVEYECIEGQGSVEALERKLTLDTINEINRIKSLKEIYSMKWESLTGRTPQ